MTMALEVRSDFRIKLSDGAGKYEPFIRSLNNKLMQVRARVEFRQNRCIDGHYVGNFDK